MTESIATEFFKITETGETLTKRIQVLTKFSKVNTELNV